jgi:dolichyl-phosphate beta-glucosyltransferase
MAVHDEPGGRRPGAGFTLVVPVFNEAARFEEFGPALVDFIAEQPAGSELVFVDDGSTDATPGLVERLIRDHPGRPVRMLARPHEGKGAAVRAGLAAGTARLRVFCDLDLSTPLEQLGRLLHVAARADVLAVGSRDLAGSRLVRRESHLREFLGRSYNRLLQATVAPGVLDTQCGAKAASSRVWAPILAASREAGYAWDAEAVGLARALDIPVQEVPIDWRHDDRSKVHVARDGAAMVLATPRIWRNVGRVAATRRRDGRDRLDAEGERIRQAERGFWWFRSQGALVATASRRVPPLDAASPWLADLGAGTGAVSTRLGWNPDRLVVIEPDAALARTARARHGLLAVRSALDALPLADSSVDVVSLLDVLQHLDEPATALRAASRALKPGGRIVVTVPAHPSLWSPADERFGHRRRYSRAALEAELTEAGFQPRILTHVFSWLVLPLWWERRVLGRRRPRLGLEHDSVPIDRLAMALTLLERQLVGRVSLPVGTSILAVADKAPTA